MDTKKRYIQLKDLEIYRLARELSRLGWNIYEKMSWQEKKIIGDQFIESTDSVGANVAEGYARFHYLDKIKVFYNSRGSLAEAVHWIELLLERKLVSLTEFKAFTDLGNTLSLKLQHFITSNYRSKDNMKL